MKEKTGLYYYYEILFLKATTPLHSTCTTMKCTHCQKDFCLPVNTISASYSQLPSSKDNNGLVCSIQPSLPSRAGKSSDVRYRSFHNFNQSSSSKQVQNSAKIFIYVNKQKNFSSFIYQVTDYGDIYYFKSSVLNMEHCIAKEKAEHLLHYLIQPLMP